MSPRLAMVLAVAVCATWIHAARAQEDANALFERGLADMLAGNFERGCPAIEESYRLEPMPGALFTLAECEAQWGKSAAALGHYEQFVASLTKMPASERERHEPRRLVASRQIEALRIRVPKLTIVLPLAAPSDTTVTLDGERLDPSSLGISQYVDPGEHQITAAAAGHEPLERTALLRDGQERTVVLELEATSQAPPKPPPDDSSQQTVAYVLGAVGLAGLLVGAITGAMALSKKGDVDDNCVGFSCNAAGKDAADEGQTLADVSTVSFVVGGLALSSGVVLWLTAPSSPDTPARAHGWAPAGRAAMMTVEGHW